MSLKQVLRKNKELFVKKWFHSTIDTYPERAALILGRNANRFDNPVGSITRESLENSFELILGDFDQEDLERAIDPVIRIRAVQVFTASEAVSFVFALKKIGQEILDPDLLREFDGLVDRIALSAFNRLMKCKEEIFLLKANESKRRIHRAFERAGLVSELKEENLPGSEKS